MSKRKQFSKQSKGKRAQAVALIRTRAKDIQQEPDTADEFLAVGVDFEEAGEKWRAGDAAKSCRFFVRAVETYESGLRRFPRSFDLAYNKARVQYDLSQQPRLLQFLPTNLPDLLQAALESHRYALSLNRDDANALFNTAQVLTSIGELLVESSLHSKNEAAPLLQEALELFQRCLEIQETQIAKPEATIDTDTNPPSDRTQFPIEDGPSTRTSSPTTEEQWATILEPTTPSTLFDTCLAQIQTLTALVPLSDSSPLTFETIDNAAISLFSKASSYVPDPAHQDVLSLSRFNLLAAISDLSYRSSLLSPFAYLESLNSLFSQDPVLSASPTAPVLYDLADALITLNASLSATTPPQPEISSAEHSLPTLLSLRWKALSSALSSLSSADKLPSSAGNRSAINARRAEAELLRVRLAEPPLPYDQALASRDTMLRNAQTYFKGARRLAELEGDAGVERQMGLRWGVVAWLRKAEWAEVEGELGSGVRREDLLRASTDMQEEGLIEKEFLEGMADGSF